MNRVIHISNVLLLLCSAGLLLYLAIYGHLKSMRNTGALLLPVCIIVRSCYIYIQMGYKPFTRRTDSIAAIICKYNGFIFMPQIAVGGAWFLYWTERCQNAFLLYRLATSSESRMRAHSDYMSIYSEIHTFAAIAIPLIVVLVLVQFGISVYLSQKARGQVTL